MWLIIASYLFISLLPTVIKPDNDDHTREDPELCVKVCIEEYQHQKRMKLRDSKNTEYYDAIIEKRWIIPYLLCSMYDPFDYKQCDEFQRILDCLGKCPDAPVKTVRQLEFSENKKSYCTNRFKDVDKHIDCIHQHCADVSSHCAYRDCTFALERFDKEKGTNKHQAEMDTLCEFANCSSDCYAEELAASCPKFNKGDFKRDVVSRIIRGTEIGVKLAKLQNMDLTRPQACSATAKFHGVQADGEVRDSAGAVYHLSLGLGLASVAMGLAVKD